MRGKVMRTRRGWIVALIVLAVLATPGVVMTLMAPADERSGMAAGERRIVVAPFEVDPSLGGSLGAGFEDSLAHRIRVAAGLNALSRDADVMHADYVLEGSVSRDGGQVRISLRLRPAGQKTAVWNATFWRASVPNPALARELAVAVGEGLRATGR